MQTRQIPVKQKKSRLFTYWLSALCFFISLPLFLNCLDSAQIKITLYYMGAISALGLWISKLYSSKENIFTRQNLIKLLPFILYAGYVIISYFFHPYIIGRMESLFKFLGICIFFTIVAFEFDKEDINILFKSVIACAWVVGIYGLVQIVDLYIYKGVDLFYWTSAFGKRIFSTIANPNFLGDYLLFSLMVVLARFCYTHYKRYILLAAILLADIFFTESKGAWMGLGISLVIFAGIYLNFFKTKLSQHKKIINISALIFFLACGVLVVHFGAKRMQSVNFRLSTWRSTWDMVQASPLTGTGFGSFQVIYQAYKRPDIFYMENLHNAETQHAENFFLEQWAVLGILGLGLFLYLVFYQLKGAFKAFKKFDGDKETACNLLAALMASSAIYLHNMVDVSIYFVSTMYFLALFNGVLFNLSYDGLEKKKPVNNEDKKFSAVTLFFCVLASLFVLLMALMTGYEFIGIALSDNILLLILYWLFLLAAAFGVLWGFGYSIWKSKKIFVAILLCVTAFLMFKAFGTLLADHYLSMASAYGMRANPATAYIYNKSVKLNPFRTSVHQFEASFFVNRFDMRKKYLPQEGDTEPMTDFERAEKYYKREISVSPNTALVWHNRGILYRKMAAYTMEKDFMEGEKYYKQSEAFFKRSLHLDPVYDSTYLQLADIASVHGDFKTARIWLYLYEKGPEDIVNEEYLKQHKNNEK